MPWLGSKVVTGYIPIDCHFLDLADSFKSEAYDNWFTNSPLTKVNKHDIQKHIFKTVSGIQYSDEDCAGKSLDTLQLHFLFTSRGNPFFLNT